MVGQPAATEDSGSRLLARNEDASAASRGHTRHNWPSITTSSTITSTNSAQKSVSVTRAREVVAQQQPPSSSDYSTASRARAPSPLQPTYPSTYPPTTSLYSRLAMPVLQETLLLNTSPQAVFDFVCNFENTEKWDPGVKSARKRGTDPTQVGTTYDLVTVLKGNESEMVYAVTDWDPPRRMRIAGESEHVTSVDVIEIEPTDDGKTKVRLASHAAAHR